MFEIDPFSLKWCNSSETEIIIAVSILAYAVIS